MRVWKLVRKHAQSSTPFMIERPGSKFVIGSERGLFVRCNSGNVSKEHCIIEFNGNKWTIQDQESLNGTYVNKVRVKAWDKVELANHDLIGIGIPDMTRDQVHLNLFVFEWILDRQHDTTNASTSTKSVCRKRRIARDCKQDPQGCMEEIPTNEKQSSSSKKFKQRTTDSSSSGKYSVETNGIISSCLICMEEFVHLKESGEELYSTPCGHIFCHKCIKSSIELKPLCPVCREKVQLSETHRVFI